MLIGKRASHPKSQMLGNVRHSLYQQKRIVHRNLDPAVNRRIGGALIDVVWTENIGEKQSVKFATFQQASQIGPVIQIDIAVGTISRVTPQSGRLVPYTIHRESVESDFLAHSQACRGGGISFK